MTIIKPSDGILRAITVREPWATLCCMGIKTCEIRSWDWSVAAFPFPMTVAVHASADSLTIDEDIDWAINKHEDAYYAFENPDCQPLVAGKDFFYGQAIVGLVDVIGSMLINPTWSKKEKTKQIVNAGFDAMYADWAEGPYSFFLANPRRFKTGIQCPGNLKVWKLKPEIQAYIEENQNNLLPRRPAPDFELLPTAPKGNVRLLGKLGK